MARTPLPMAGRAAGPTGIARGDDRRIAFGGLVVSGLFLVAALVSLALPPEVRRGAWLPLHLALAGGASVAIASIMPFFTSALSAAPPAGPRTRIAVIASATGAPASRSASGRAQLCPPSAARSSSAASGLAGRRSRRLSRPRPAPRSVALAYGSAIASRRRASLAILPVAGWGPVAGQWAR